jgi:HEAT repeat protein
MAKAHLLFLLLFLPLSLFGDSELFARRMQVHLVLGDWKGGILESEKALKEYPEEPLVLEWAIHCFAAAGEHEKMMRLWQQYAHLFCEQAYKRDLLEKISWAILKKGSEMGGKQSQLISLLGAGLTQDRLAIPFLLSGMRNSSALIRSLAVQLAAFYSDEPLREEMKRLFVEESNQDVRQEVLLALGSLNCKELIPEMIAIIGSRQRTTQERKAAIEAILEMQESLSLSEIAILVKSERAGLRELACEVVAQWEIDEALPLIMPLILDSQPDVQVAALRAVGLFSFKKKELPELEKITDLATHAKNPQVAVTAAWILLLSQGTEGPMELWLQHPRPLARALAAAAIAHAGEKGSALANKYFKRHEDPYVRANLALALLFWRENCEAAAHEIDLFLQNQKEPCEIKEVAHFSLLHKSTLKHHPLIPNYPEVVNQTARLNLINLLALLEYPDAIETLKRFFTEKQWQVTGLAAEFLLGEGDESATALIKELLHHSNRELQREAAFVLATWSKDPDAVPVLLELYPQSTREMKIKILETLSRVQDSRIIPFLMAQLNDRSQLIRMMIASILIQTLNH